VHSYNRYGKKSLINTKSRLNQKIKEIKTSNLKIRNNNINNIKVINNKKEVTPISTNNNKTLNSIKTKLVKTTNKIKRIGKITVSSIKSIITGTKAIIELLIAGGWLAVVIIILICIVGMLCSSMYGIFFSNEENNSIKIQNIILDINKEIDTNIEKIKRENSHDSVVIDLSMIDWKNVLAFYSIKVSGNNYEVITLDNTKVKEIKKIFWELNTINYYIKEEEYKKVFYIDVTSKTIDEMTDKYGFTFSQKEELKEILSSDYFDLWNDIIYQQNTNDWIFPVGGIYTITTYFSNEHKALDIASSYGSKIYAINDGIITIAKEGCVIGDLTCNGKAGNYITIKHNNSNYISSYMHLKSINVKVGDKVKKGQIIGYMGNTGNVIPIPNNKYSTSGTHLHFVIEKEENKINPIVLYKK